MKQYMSVLKIKFTNCLQYRTAALAGMCTQIFWGFMFIMIYEAFYKNKIGNQTISFQELVDYLWLQQAFLSFITLFNYDDELGSLIVNGNISYELCRPCGIYEIWFAKFFAQRFAAGLLRCFPILLISMFLLPSEYSLKMPKSGVHFILFSITMMMGLLLVVALAMLVYISVFVTMSQNGSNIIAGVIGEFFSGLIIPIPFMPDWLKSIAYILPYRLTTDLPIRTYSGNIEINEALIGLGSQIIWFIVLVIIGKLAMNKVLKNVVAQGG